MIKIYGTTTNFTYLPPPLSVSSPRTVPGGPSLSSVTFFTKNHPDASEVDSLLVVDDWRFFRFMLRRLTSILSSPPVGEVALIYPPHP